MSAFIAKAVLNLRSTRQLIDRWKVDEPLRRICGWHYPSDVPSTFSRAFHQFAKTELPQKLHQAVIQANQKYWRGYKLHVDVADGQIPISCVLTAASGHDSQVAIPLATMTASRVTSILRLDR